MQPLTGEPAAPLSRAEAAEMLREMAAVVRTVFTVAAPEATSAPTVTQLPAGLDELDHRPVVEAPAVEPVETPVPTLAPIPVPVAVPVPVPVPAPAAPPVTPASPAILQEIAFLDD